MRSSSGGWVSNRRLRRDMRPSSSVRAIGCSIQRWAVAREPECDDRLVVLQLLQRGDQPRRVPGHLDAGEVGQRLAPAADRELHTLAMIGARISRTKPTMARIAAGAAAVTVVVVPPAAAPPQEADAEVGQQRDDADHGHGQGRHEDVVVLDVAELVGQHALELDPVHLLQQPGGDRDGRVLGVAAGGEGVRGRRPR